MEILDGKLVSSKIKEEIKETVDKYVSAGLKAPVLTAILVGNDPASEIYVRNKEKACEKCGFKSKVIKLPVNISQEELNKTIDNAATESNGVIVQLPLPKGLNADHMENYPDKDVDGFTRKNMGKLVLGEDCFIPATPYGITLLLDYYKIETEGKNVVIIGRSNIVGKPMANLLMNKPYNANVTVLHSKTPREEMQFYCSTADIIIVAVGKPNWFGLDNFVGSWYDKDHAFYNAPGFKEGLTVIDVGINRTKEGKVVGDVNVNEIDEYIEYKVTPVPGGVGPMTICGLMKNTLKAYENNHKDKIKNI